MRIFLLIFCSMAAAQQIPPIEETGFRQIFDGKTLNGWDGEPGFWRVENGTIVGETSAQKQPKQNTFLIWRGGSPSDFELKLEYRLTGFNSGIQYRSIELPDIKWAMKGYQADMDGEQRYTGQIYEERGRGFLALRGQYTYIGDGRKPALVGSVGDGAELKKVIKDPGWNDLDIIARGNTLIQIWNGRIMSMLVDEDKANRKMDGLIGIQIHRGPMMKIEARHIRIKEFDDPEGKKLAQRVCGHCHKLDIVTSRRLTRERWQQTIQAMVDKGAEGTEEEFNAVLDYLSKYYGPDTR